MYISENEAGKSELNLEHSNTGSPTHKIVVETSRCISRTGGKYAKPAIQVHQPHIHPMVEDLHNMWLDQGHLPVNPSSTATVLRVSSDSRAKIYNFVYTCGWHVKLQQSLRSAFLTHAKNALPRPELHLYLKRFDWTVGNVEVGLVSWLWYRTHTWLRISLLYHLLVGEKSEGIGWVHSIKSLPRSYDWWATW